MVTETKQQKKVKIIYNDDVAVLDFLADMADRKAIHHLQRFINWSDQKPHLILEKSILDNIVVLILYKSPFDFNEVPNKLMLYIHSDIGEMIRYFQKFEELMPPKDPLHKKMLNDINRLLYIRWAEEKDEDVSLNHHG